MDKTKTSKKQKKFSIRDLQKHDPFQGSFADAKVIKEILVQALMEDDIATFEDVLLAHLRATSKSSLAKKTGIGRQTLYDLLNKDKEFNPTLTTLAAILKSIAA
jgi:DNA-binding phage protein